MIIVGEPDTDDPDYLICCHTETELLTRFRDRLIAIDPDILTGWNVLDFDLPTLCTLERKLKDGDRWPYIFL